MVACVLVADLSIQVELLIRAHDCYTKGCSVDGKKRVLSIVVSRCQLNYKNGRTCMRTYSIKSQHVTNTEQILYVNVHYVFCMEFL